MQSKLKMGGIFVVECFDRYGNPKWDAVAHNKVVNQGIQKLLDVGFTGDTAVVSPWYIGLLASTAVLSTHTLSNISEATEYSQANRPAYVEARSAQTLTNSANKSTFSINKDGTTIEGAFLASSNTIGSTAGILMCGAPFTGGAKVGDSGDSLQVTYTFVGSDDTSS